MNAELKKAKTVSRQSQFPGRLIRFECLAPLAKSVYLVGDFNDWNPSCQAMVRLPDGRWRAEVPLRSGACQYQFLIDGQPTLDPAATVSSSRWNGHVSSISV